jgi:hypothetical protein
VAFGFYDLGGGNLLVINETTSLPYAIQNLYGATLLGGGSGPTIKYSVGGTALVPGDQLVGGATSSGTPGSGTAVVGFLAIDTTGHVTANIIPRTNTLASLEALALGIGELASATDIPAIVQGTGTAGVNYAIFPFNSTQSGSFTGTGAIAGTVPCTTDAVRVTLGTGVTSFTGTLQAGLIDGQVLTVDVISTPTTVTGITLNGVVVADNTGTNTGIASNNIPTNPQFSVAFKWVAASTVWQMVSIGPIPAALGTYPYAVNIPASNTAAGTAITGYVASGLGAIAIGPNTVYAAHGATVGNHNKSTGGLASILGNQNLAFNNGAILGASGQLWGTNAVVLAGGTGYAGGISSVSIAGGATGNSNFGPNWTVATSISLVSGTTYLVSVPSTAGIENTMIVVLQLGGANGYCVSATVSSLIANTSFRVTITAANAAIATAIVPLWLTNNLTQFVNISSGQSSVAVGGGALAQNNRAEATSFAYIANPGDTQNERVRLIGQSTGTTALTLDVLGAGGNTNTTRGLSTRYIPATGQCGSGWLSIVAQDEAAGGGMVSFLRRVSFHNSAGTLSITQTPFNPAGGATGDVATGSLSALTFAGNVTVSANATYQSLDVSVTGTGALTINWMATLSFDTVI